LPSFEKMDVQVPDFGQRCPYWGAERISQVNARHPSNPYSTRVTVHDIFPLYFNIARSPLVPK